MAVKYRMMLFYKGLIFRLNQWNCVSIYMCSYTHTPLSTPSHLIFVCFIALQWLCVYLFRVCVADRWQQPGWELWWGFVHGIMQSQVSANTRDLSLSKTPHFPWDTLKDTAHLQTCPPLHLHPRLSLSLSYSNAPTLHTIILFAETVMHYLLSSATFWTEWAAHFTSPGSLLVICVRWQRYALVRLL